MEKEDLLNCGISRGTIIKFRIIEKELLKNCPSELRETYDVKNVQVNRECGKTSDNNTLNNQESTCTTSAGTNDATLSLLDAPVIIITNDMTPGSSSAPIDLVQTSEPIIIQQKRCHCSSEATVCFENNCLIVTSTIVSLVMSNSFRASR